VMYFMQQMLTRCLCGANLGKIECHASNLLQNPPRYTVLNTNTYSRGHTYYTHEEISGILVLKR
jgi:hypothetical protein